MQTRTALRRVDPLLFHVDRPFLFFVDDEKSGSVLFAGRCTTPKPVASEGEDGRSRVWDFLRRVPLSH